jgi:glycine/D-amino acid oxidase-like deaminating enzyme
MSSFRLSFWERQSHFTNIDVLIVGGGIVGLNSALQLKLAEPALRVSVVDGGPFLPYGASTRNAGFACFGSMSELLDDLEKSDENEVFSLVRKRWEGLQRLRNLLGDATIHYEPLGGYELFTAQQKELFEQCMSHLERFNKLLYEISGQKNMYAEVSSEIAGFGFNKVSHLILNHGEGQLDTGRMMQALTAKVRSMGVDVLTGITVLKMEEYESGVRLFTGHEFTIDATKVLVTTNAFARQLLPDLDVNPGRAQVLITTPFPQLPFKGSFHYDRGYFYFRNVGNRVLFGGGRNLDFSGEKTTEFGLTSMIQDRLEVLLKEVILPGQDFEVEQRWSGIMGLGPVKSAIVKKIQPGIYCAVRMGGMGVAIGSIIGEEAAEMILSD